MDAKLEKSELKYSIIEDEKIKEIKGQYDKEMFESLTYK